MVGGGLLASAIEWALGLIGAHGFEAGLLATALVVAYHGHSMMAFGQAAFRSARIGFIGAATVGLLIVVSVSMGWMDVEALPSFGWVWEVLPL